LTRGLKLEFFKICMKFISNLCKLNIMIVKSKKIEQDINIVKDIY
jgi:hypothetical protein